MSQKEVRLMRIPRLPRSATLRVKSQQAKWEDPVYRALSDKLPCPFDISVFFFQSLSSV